MCIRDRLLTVFIFSFCNTVSAQGTIKDYQRAELFNGLFQNKIYYSPNNIKWLKDKKHFFYSMLTEKGTELILVNGVDLSKKPAFDQEKLAVILSELSKTKLAAFKLPISNVSMNNNATNLQFNYDDKLWLSLIHI